jgi:hypothetical protein
MQVAATAELYGVSADTVYRGLRAVRKPKAAHRADFGQPRVLPKAELERYCELIAALKLRTTNQKGRHLSTRRAIELLEDFGVETPHGLIRVPQGLLSPTTVNDYLSRWHLDQPRLTRQPVAVRFQAESSNACWQFDLSPSDLKQVEAPLWFEPGRGAPTLMLFSVVDDRSGVGYQEYRCVYGEDAESALRFLFNAMAPQAHPAGVSVPGHSGHAVPGQRSGSQEPGLSECHGGAGRRVPNPPAGRQGRSPRHGPFERQGGTAVSHGEGGA